MAIADEITRVIRERIQSFDGAATESAMVSVGTVISVADGGAAGQPVTFEASPYGVTLDRASQAPVVIVSAAGGIDIEEVAEKEPEKIIRQVIPEGELLTLSVPFQDAAGDVEDVFRVHDHGGVAHHLRQRAQVGGHHRRARGHRLERRQPEALVE